MTFCSESSSAWNCPPWVESAGSQCPTLAEDPFSEVFWFAKHNAFLPTMELERTLLLHVAAQDREHELLASYAAA